MWPMFVIMLPPLLDYNLSLTSVAEPLQVQAFVSQLPIEALIQPVLPRLASIYLGRLHSAFAQPLFDRFRHELRAVIASQVLGLPV